jgi:NAD(P)-dependent dehydrogenase (short-subunit alcohol dehydrogenase family)
LEHPISSSATVHRETAGRSIRQGPQSSSIVFPLATHSHEKVFIVTGSTSGIGRALAGILYQRNAKVYIAARSETKAHATIDEIKQEHPDSKGELVHLHLDLNDLTTIKASADEFLSKESRLDVLWNNAGVMVPPQGSKSAQGYELQIGTNNLAPFLFTELLHPIMKQTAQTAPKNSVRVIWVSSSAAQYASRPAIDLSNMDYKREEGIWPKYIRSKAGNVLHSAEFARRTKGEGIISLVGEILVTLLIKDTYCYEEPESREFFNEPPTDHAHMAKDPFCTFYTRCLMKS